MPGVKRSTAETLEERVFLTITADVATTPLVPPPAVSSPGHEPAAAPFPSYGQSSKPAGPITFVQHVASTASFVAEAANQPIGVAQGIYAGRVTWAHDSTAVNQSFELGIANNYYWEARNNNQPVIDELVGKTVRWLTNQPTDQLAWDALFRNFNSTRGLGNVGYTPGEKITIKVNLNNTWEWGINKMDPRQYQMGVNNWADSSPQGMLALLNQLVNKAGVRQQDIYLIEPGRYFVDRLYNVLHAAYPDVHYVDRLGINGREKAIPTATPILKFSNGTQQAFVPQQFVDSKYLINLSMLKKHEMGGFTCAGKNQYGSIWTTDNTGGIEWSPGSVHNTLPVNLTSTGQYSQMVDINGHPQVGGKTLLYMIDALWAGWHSNRTGSEPRRWLMSPFYGQYPASFFASQDFVAIESVALDFLRAEDPLHTPRLGQNGLPIVPYADNPLHEAALAGMTGTLPPGITYSGTAYKPDGANLLSSLGTHEHWNDSVSMQYSRNLGTGNGIELISSASNRAPTDIAISSTSISEKQSVGALVGTLTTTDSDITDTFTYSLPSDVADNAQFTISGDQLLAAASFNHQTKDSYSILVRSTDLNGAYFEKTFTINILDITAPTVVGVQVNDGTAQRSMVKSLTVTFSEAVELGAAFLLEMADGPAVAGTALEVSGSGNVYTIVFKGTAVVGSSLADGAYRLRIIPSGVQDASGNAMQNEFTFLFKRLFGDYDGNASVNAADYYYFKGTFGKSKDDSGYVDCMDFDGNGVVNAADYYYFKRNFGKSI